MWLSAESYELRLAVNRYATYRNDSAEGKLQSRLGEGTSHGEWNRSSWRMTL